MDLEAVRDDDHVVALYRERGLWGSIAKSNFAGLRFRAPIYRTLRELALSYFDSYYNLRGERTLRSYSCAVNLARLDNRQWMTAAEDVWCVPELLIAARHYPLFPDKIARSLPRLDRRSFEAGMHGRVKHGGALLPRTLTDLVIPTGRRPGAPRSAVSGRKDLHLLLLSLLHSQLRCCYGSP